MGGPGSGRRKGGGARFNRRIAGEYRLMRMNTPGIKTRSQRRTLARQAKYFIRSRGR